MDFTDALKAGGASATLITIVGIGVKLFQSFCGHRLRSECCGREGTVGVAVEQMTPRTPRPSIEVRVVPDKPIPPADIAAPSRREGSHPSSHTGSPLSATAPAINAPLPPPLAI